MSGWTWAITEAGRSAVASEGGSLRDKDLTVLVHLIVQGPTTLDSKRATTATHLMRRRLVTRGIT